jgi:hypothetical protein
MHRNALSKLSVSMKAKTPKKRTHKKNLVGIDFKE